MHAGRRQEALPAERLILALDVETVQGAEGLVNLLRGRVGAFKVGLQLVVSNFATVHGSTLQPARAPD